MPAFAITVSSLLMWCVACNVSTAAPASLSELPSIFMAMTELPWPVGRVESALDAVELGSRTPAMTVKSGRAR